MMPKQRFAPVTQPQTMILIGHTEAGGLIFSPGPGDDPCLVRVVNPKTKEIVPETQLAFLPGPWSLSAPFDPNAWGALFAPGKSEEDPHG